jgi:hypothetical protein
MKPFRSYQPVRQVCKGRHSISAASRRYTKKVTSLFDLSKFVRSEFLQPVTVHQKLHSSNYAACACQFGWIFAFWGGNVDPWESPSICLVMCESNDAYITCFLSHQFCAEIERILFSWKNLIIINIPPIIMRAKSGKSSASRARESINNGGRG